ncbi:Ig-like domain-containing protein [Pedobacter metabolipauper]|uniref:Gliding motility-associated-like protein n=1 Tax=Pedobacter metabolipauper TaxID=425513 RepID=A0A4R6SY40_9SPHI|nr:putative Ig domain-containing protein [Pedobacter metabolipauper]TDQ10143.1 gliding motility-associated-like protein [Pedobacter metabolipauper]
MTWTSTRTRIVKKPLFLLLCLLGITLINSKSYAQSRTYANQVVSTSPNGMSSLTGCGFLGLGACYNTVTVENAANALTADPATFATLKSSGGTALGLGSYFGAIELQFAATVPAGKTAYVRIDFEDDVLNALLGGNLGGALANLTGGLVLGNHSFTVEARNNATTVLTGNSSNSLTDAIRLIKDANGNFYIALTPTQAYNRIYIRDNTDALLLGSTNSMKVYNAFYTSGSADICAQAFATGFEGTGLTVDLLGLGKAGVINAQNAIDANTTNFSEVSLGVLGVAGSISQNFYFENLSSVGDDINIRLQLSPALLNAGVLNNISVTGYNGTTQTFTQSLSSLINLDLLGLLNTSVPVSIPVTPGAQFDRIKITLSSLLNVSLTQTINLYAVTRSAGRPAFSTSIPNAVSICAGSTASLSAITLPDNELIWYESITGGTAVATVQYNEAYTTPALSATKTYYVAARRKTCTEESARVPVTVTVTQIPDAPVIAAVTPVCSGSAATLSVSAPVTGVTYNWYSVATGGTILGTGNSFTTGALTAATTFYVEAVTGTCVNATRTAVVVPVNPLPALAVVTTNNETISSGQTATLRATAGTGDVVQWFAAATGGSPIFVGNNFTTPPLSATTTYYAGTLSAAGCTSATRVPVVVTVVNGPVNPNCNAAVSQQTGIDGICLLCGITGAGNSTDSNPATFTAINLAVGVGATGYQRLIFANPGSSTDSIRLDLETPTGLADLSVLSGVTVRIMNGTTVVSTYPLNSPLLDLQLLTGNRFVATVPAGGVYDRVEIRFGALVSALSSLNIYGAEIIYPNPTVAATGLEICSGGTTTLSATANGGTTLKWFSLPAGGTEVGSGETFTTPALTATTTYYIEVSKGGCANVQRIPVTVTVNPAIVFTAAPLSNATVAAAYSKQITPATGGTPAFTYTLAPGSVLPAGLTLSGSGSIGGTPAVAGNFSFSILATDSKGCVATANYTLNVTPALSLPAAALPIGIVNTSYTVQTLPAATGGTTPFTYAVNQSSLPPGLTFNDTNRQISGTPSQSGTYTIPLTATDANGYSISRDYTLVVRDPLVLPGAVLATGILNQVYTTQTIPAATGGSGPYTYSATGLQMGLTFNPLTRQIAGTPTVLGANTFAVKVVDADGTTVTTNYTINVIDPLMLAPKVLADGTAGTPYVTQTIPAATGGTPPYSYVASNLPAGLSFNDTNNQITGTPTQSGTFNINVVVTDASNATASQTYILKINGVLSLPSAVLADGLVGSVYTTQTLPAVTGGTSPYTYSVTGLPPGINFNTSTRQLSGTPTTGGTYTIKLTATDASSLSTSTDYTLVVNVGAPMVASATICSGSATTLSVSNVIPGVVYTWYPSTGTTPVFTGASYTTPALTANTTYYVEASSGTAVSSRTTVNVTINPMPAQATVITNNEIISSGQSATLQASAEAGSTIKWYETASGGTAVFTGASFTTPVLTATKTYYVETENASGCVSASRVPVTVTVTNNPVNPNCNAAVSQQTGIDGICLLCNVQGAGNSTDADLNNFTAINLSVGVGATGYQRLIFANAGLATDSIRLDLETPTGLADLGILSGITVRVMNGNTVVSTYALNSSLIDLQLLSGRRFRATVAAGGAYDRVEVRFGAVVAALSSLNIYGATVIYPNPTVAASGQQICSGSSTTLSAAANGGTTLKWFASPTSTTVLASGETFNTPVLTTTTTYYIEVSKGTCANADRVPVTVTVTTIPSAPVAATVAPICSGSTAVLSVNTPVTDLVYSWYSTATGGTALATGTSFSTPALTASTTYYVEAASGTCVSTSRTAVQVTVSPVPDQAVVTTNNETISSGQTATLMATATAGNTINWYAAPAGGSILATGPSFTTAALTATTTYYVETVNASGCVSSARVPVTVTVIGGTPNPNCNAANSQQSGIDGICLLCSVQNPGSSVDNNFTNFTTLSLPVGIGGSVYQRLIFPGAGVGTDSIRLNLETPGGLADVTLLGGIQVRIMNGSSIVATYTLGNSLLNLSLLSGNRFIATLPATGAYDRVEVRANGLASVLVNLRVYGAEVIYPNPTVSANGQVICSGNATMLSAAANGGTTLRWYSAATGGTLLFTGENFTTPVLTATTTYYIEVSKGSCANVQRVPVTVTVTTAPAAPVVAAVPPVCSGSAAVISVTAPVTGTDYNWYTTATGGTPVFTGAVFTTPALTTNTIYYVEAANGSCISTTRTAVPVGVNPLPVLPQVQASASTVNPGQTVILTATSTESNITFNWYTSSASTTPVFTGATYVTPPLTVTTTYYIEAVSNTTGCAASNRVQVTITVDGNGSPSPVPCEAPTTQANGVTGVALLAGVFNAQLAIDNDTRTASSLVMPVGLLGASVYQRLGFSAQSNVGDTVRVLLSAPGKLLSLGLLSNIQVSTYVNNTSNNDGVSLNNMLVNLELLSNNTQALVTFVPTQPFNQIEIRLNSGVANALSTVDVNYAQRVVVAPQVTSANVSVCETQQAVLTVLNPNPGITYKWYDAAGTYQAGQDGTTFTTPALTAGTRYFVEANTASGCTSYRTAVNVTVTPTPQTPVLVSPTINTCANSDVIIQISNPLIGITYKWYNAAGVYQAGQDGIAFTVTNVTGPVTYRVEAVNSCGIASARATATVNVGTIDLPVVTPAAVTIRSGSPAVLTATSSSANAVFNWYATASSPTILFTGARYQTDPLINTGSTPAMVTYYVEAVVPGGCPASGRASVVVTVIPDGTSTDVPCEAASVQVRGGVDGAGILSGLFNPQLAVDNNSESASSFVMPVGLLGASVHQLVGFDGLSTIGDTVRVRISSPGKLLSLGVFPSIELTTYKGLVSNNDMIVASNPGITLELMSDNSSAILTFVPQQQFDGVELRLRSGVASVLTTLDFNYAQRILVAPSVLSANATACVGTSTTLTVRNPVAGFVYKWYLGGTYLAGQDGTSIQTSASLTPNTYDYFVSANRLIAATGSYCESAKTKVTVTILAAPDAPVPTAANITTCPNTPVTLSVTPVTGISFNWYSAATGGMLLASNTATYTTPANLTAGIYEYYVAAVNGNSCGSTAARTKITVTVNPTASVSDINITNATLSLCTGSVANLTATLTSTSTITAPVFTWYSDAALTNAVFQGANYQPTVLATTTYYVTVRGANRCENIAADAKAVVVVVNPPATAADLSVSGADMAYCIGTKAELTAMSTTVLSPVFSWYRNAALTDKAFEGPVFLTPMLTGPVTYYVTVKGSNKCENLAGNAEVVTITVNPPALASDISIIGGGSPVCIGATVALTATTTTVINPVFTWYSDAALTNRVSLVAGFTTPPLTGPTTYYVTVSGANKCENTPATARSITINVNPPAIAADINVNGAGSFCTGAQALLTASSATVTNPVFTWYSDAALLQVVYVGAAFNTDPLTATTTYYVTVRGANKCENTPSTAKAVTVVVNPPALASDINVTGAEAPFCAGTAARLMATSTLPSPVFTWYTDAALTNPVFTGPVFNTAVLTATTIYYVTVRSSDRCENTVGNAKIITLTVNPPAIASDIIVSGADGNFCSGNAAILNASSTTVQNPIFTWYTDAALTNAVFTGSVFTTPILTATRTYYVTVRGSNKCENTAATARAVTLVVNPPALASDISVVGADVSFCTGAIATLTATTSIVNPVFTWYADAALTQPVANGAVFTTPLLTATTIYYVTVSGAGKCENTSATAKSVTLVVNTPAIAADINIAGAAISYCAGSRANLNASSMTVTNPVFTWYRDASLTQVEFIGPVFMTPVLTQTTTFYVTVKGSNRCENTPGSAKEVTLIVNPTATAADINVDGANAPLCAGSIASLTASSTTVSGPIFTWYSDAALTNPVFTGPVFNTPAMIGTTTYYVTVRGANKCENLAGDAEVVTITVNPPAIASDVIVSGANGPVCAGTMLALTASTTTVQNPVFTWYDDAALTNAVFTGETLTITAINSTITYYVTVRGTNKCENKAGTARVVTVAVNPLPEAPVIANGGTVSCSGEQTVLTVQNAQPGILYQWYTAATGGNPIFTGAQFTTGMLNADTDYYVAAVSAAGCGNSTGRVKVTVLVAPKPLTPTVVSPNVTVCAGSVAVLRVSNPQTGVTYKWYTAAVGGTLVGTGEDFTTPAISTMTNFYVEASNATCISTARAAVTVTPAAIPLAPLSVTVSTVPLCSGSTTVLTVNNPDASLTYKWYTAMSGGTAVAEGIAFTTPGLTATTTYYVESVNKASGCTSASRTAVVVTVVNKLVAPVVSVQSKTAISITFQWNPVTGATGYEVSVDNGLTWTAPSSGATGTTHLILGLKPDQSVTIRVRAIGQLDCQLSDTSTLTDKTDNPLGNTIFIPNTFTPNNDGKNDVFYVYATTIAKMKLRVYNQWGQFIYESLNVQSGWDGTFKGEIQPNGVYVYYLEVEFNDGSKTTKKGTITLLR